MCSYGLPVCWYTQGTVEEAQYFITGTNYCKLQIQFLLEISPALKGEVQFDPICFKKLDCESTKLKRYLYIGMYCNKILWRKAK